MSRSRRKRLFKVQGMDCAEEVAVLKGALVPVVGGPDHLEFDVLNGRLAVVDAEGVTVEAIVKAVARTGMSAEPWHEGQSVPGAGSFWQGHGRTFLTAVSSVLLGLGVVVHAWAAQSFLVALGIGEAAVGRTLPWAAQVLYGLAILAGSWFVLPKAWHALRQLRPDMNLLMTVAILGAVALGDWLEAATVAFLFSLSLTLESWSVGRARRAVAALLDLAPVVVHLLSSGQGEQDVPPTQVAVGARFSVRPGERFALDGRIVEGSSEVNQAPITGESVPVPKKTGDEVFAGTINGDGALLVESTKPAGDTTLARIIRMVGEAQSRRAPSEQWVEKFARVYTPTVMAAAVLLLLVLAVIHGAAWSAREQWLYPPLVLLVIACPCALVVSTPVSIVAALACAARQGVLIKGGMYVEAPSRLRALALDKTGTLTEGRPRVAQVVPLGNHNEQELLERAAALEGRSTHPLARAIVEYAKDKGIHPQPVEDLQAVQGKGATARFKDRSFWIGSHRYLEERGQETPEVHEQLEALSRSGRSVVVVGNDQHACGFIALADAVRPQAPAAMQALRNAGVEHIVMLTGDNQGTAARVAAEAGVTEVRAELLPGDKVAAVEELVAKYGQVAMVGDGVNDAPALGRATLGIAMGAVGSDAAIETADIALMSDDLSKLAWLILHSRRTLGIIRQNIVFSLAVKAVFVILTLVGHASLWAAIAADTGATLLVIGNALRLLRTPSSF